MSTVIWIVVIGSLFLLFMRGGCCGGHRGKHGSGRHHSGCGSSSEHEDQAESHTPAGKDQG